MVVVSTVVLVVGESPPPPVDTLGFDDEHAAPIKARATTHAASPARRREIRRSGEWDGCTVVEVELVMTVSTASSPVRFTREKLTASLLRSEFIPLFFTHPPTPALKGRGDYILRFWRRLAPKTH